MAFNLATFRKLVPSFARDQFYIVRIPQIGNEDIVTALAKNTVIPGMDNAVADVFYRGLSIKIQTKPVFSDWAVTFICDEAHSIRNVFLKWREAMFNVQTLSTAPHDDYKADGLSVSQVAPDGSITSTVTFYGAFPKTVSEITVKQEGGNIEEFTVTFTYDYNLMNSLTGDVVFNDVDIDVQPNGVFSGVTVKGIAGINLKL